MQHEGVVTNANAVLHNTPDKGEHVSTLHEFADGKPLQVHHTTAPLAMLRARAQQLLRRLSPAIASTPPPSSSTAVRGALASRP